MKVKVVKIGNSRGIRIPKVYLHQSGIDDEVNLDLEDNQIILRPVKRKVRNGWDLAFKRMAELKEDQVPGDENLYVQNAFDQDEWTW
jgi:antitoxin MazE